MIEKLIFIFISFILLIVIYLNYKSEEERDTLLKLIGYFILGAIILKFNWIPIPIGMSLYIILFKSKTNMNLKRISVCLVFFMMLYILIIPKIQYWSFDRVREIGISTKNIYLFKIENDFQLIKDNMNFNKQVKIKDFCVEFKRNGDIDNLEYEYIKKGKRELIAYKVIADFKRGVYKISPRKIKHIEIYDALIEEEHFFQVLNQLDIDKIRPEGAYRSFGIVCSGEYGSWSVKNWKSYINRNGIFERVKDENLPVEGYVFNLWGNEELSHNIIVSSQNKAYIFSNR